MSGSRPVKEFERVSLAVTFYCPTKEAVMACERGENFRPPAIKQQHTGILQEFVHQIDDSRDDDLIAFEKLCRKSNSFNSAIHDMTPETRLRLYFSIPSIETDQRNVSVGLRAPWQDNEKLITLPEDPHDPDLALKALVPYERVRNFLHFWENKLAGPIHSIRFAGGSLLTQSDIRLLGKEFHLN